MMGIPRHTPGPWTHIAQDNVIVCNRSLPLFQWQAISGPTLPAEERDANTRLVSAAPELLAACQSMMLWARRVSDELIEGEGLGKKYVADLDAAESAIAKAVG